MLTAAYHTLGCKVNQYETERIRIALESLGLITVPFESSADVYVVNTCSVTGAADSKSRAAVRRASRLNPCGMVVVTGCYAELEPLASAKIEGVDLVVGNGEKETLAERIAARLGIRADLPLLSGEEIEPRTRTRAVVKVQDGCDQFCSYCVIPYARPNMRSIPLTEVLDEIRTLVDCGYPEIVLTGIRLGSYKDGTANIAELVERVADIPNIGRVRLSSIEQWEVTPSLMQAMRHPKICRHLHIPLQSGDGNVLALMNRRYDPAAYLETIECTRETIPHIGITTDVIAGFPGEDDAAFEQSRLFIQEIGFSRIHVFRFSPRRRTRAFSMPGEVEHSIVKLRAGILEYLAKSSMESFSAGLVGGVYAVLVESRSHAGATVGYTDNYVEVRFPPSAVKAGQIVPIKIVGVEPDGAVRGVRII